MFVLLLSQDVGDSCYVTVTHAGLLNSCFCNSGSKPLPYEVAISKTCFMEGTPWADFYCFDRAFETS